MIDDRATMASNLPLPSASYCRASKLDLAKQGLQMYYSSFVGPLRTSRAQRLRYRSEGKIWHWEALKLWAAEFGMNAVVSMLMGLLVLTLGGSGLLSILLALIVPPMLVILQMYVDASRSDTLILRAVDSSTGLTVRRGPEGNWSYFNHFALPIGKKRGVGVRSHLHDEAKKERQLLSCYAQNEPVAAYYLREREGGTREFQSHRPLLFWDYSGGARQWAYGAKKGGVLARLLGVNNVRSAGQMPRRDR